MKSIHQYLSTWMLRALSIALGAKKDIDPDMLFNTSHNIVEVCSERVRFSSYFKKQLSIQYLGLQSDRDNVIDSTNEPIYVVEQSLSLKQNNADILIVSDPIYIKRLWYFNDYRHAQYVLCAPLDIYAYISGLPGLLRNIFYKRVRVVGTINIEDNFGSQCPVLIIEILKKTKLNARRYISPLLGVEGFFKYLNNEQVKYTILRWFEDLPKIMPGEDIDMLIADEDIETLEAILHSKPGIIPCDIYTISGLPGTSYRNMAYYPPRLSNQIIEESIIFKQFYRVPSPENHFYSLAYHAIYHKGKKSGIPFLNVESKYSGLEKYPEHEYADVLRYLAQSLDIQEEITIENLDDLLERKNWRPPQDILARLDSHDLWVGDSKCISDEIQALKGLTIFFIRQKALDYGVEQVIIDSLSKEGFNILDARIMTTEESLRVKNEIRGGNWGKGPWPQSGGDPSMILVTLDLIPFQPNIEDLVKQPQLSNGRITVKSKIRDIINKLLPAEQHCNILHSSDNEQQAWEYLQIALPQECANTKKKVQDLFDVFETDYPVKKILTRLGRRAKIELIEYRNQLAIKKTFRPDCEKYFERELFVCQSFGEECSKIPELIDYGSNYLIFKYYKDTLLFEDRQNRMLPLAIVKQAMQTLDYFRNKGYAIIDFQPSNIILDRNTGLKILDFEFLYQYKEKPDSLQHCYELLGIPEDFDGDKPDFGPKMSYQKRWEPYVGLSLESLLNDSLWMQYIKRINYGLSRIVVRYFKLRIRTLKKMSINAVLYFAKQIKLLFAR